MMCTRSIPWGRVLAFLVGHLLEPTRRAEAESNGPALSGLFVIGGAILTTDIAMTGYDLVKVGKDERPSRTYGFLEAVVRF